MPHPASITILSMLIEDGKWWTLTRTSGEYCKIRVRCHGFDYPDIKGTDWQRTFEQTAYHDAETGYFFSTIEKDSSWGYFVGIISSIMRGKCFTIVVNSKEE